MTTADSCLPLFQTSVLRLPQCSASRLRLVPLGNANASTIALDNRIRE
jgi:hypothetical protein